MNDREKIPKRSLFDPDRLVWRGISSGMDLVYVSVLWLLCSIPVITIGAATTALYDTVVHCVRRREEGIVARFFNTFRAEFKTATLSWLMWLAGIGLCALLAVYLLANGEGTQGFLFRVNLVVALVVVIGSLVWVFPVLSRFTMGFGGLNLAAVKLVFSHLPATLVMGALTLLSGLACYVWLYPALLLPGLAALLNSLYVENIFQKLTENQRTEDEETEGKTD